MLKKQQFIAEISEWLDNNLNKLIETIVAPGATPISTFYKDKLISDFNKYLHNKFIEENSLSKETSSVFVVTSKYKEVSTGKEFSETNAVYSNEEDARNFGEWLLKQEEMLDRKYLSFEIIDFVVL